MKCSFVILGVVGKRVNASAVSGEPFADEMIAFFFAIAVEMDRTDVRYIYIYESNKQNYTIGWCKLQIERFLGEKFTLRCKAKATTG